MQLFRHQFPKFRSWVVSATMAIFAVQSTTALAEQIPVKHVEGVTLGFLVLRSLEGKDLAYGESKQVVTPEDKDLVVTTLRFKFKDGSFYEEITKYTQGGKFRLLSDQTVQKGPAFKRQSESWIDAKTGKVTYRTLDEGKEKTTIKQISIPADAVNGLLFAILKNIDPSAQTTVSYVAALPNPRVVKWIITPAQEKAIKVGLIEQKTQHYIIKTKIPGVAGKVAPIVGKQPPDINVWLVKSEAPTFAEFEGQLSPATPVWRIELAAPEPDSPK